MKKVLRTFLKDPRINYILPSCIVLFAALLRLYHYPQRFGFDYDALRDSLLTRYAVLHNQIPLIGPPTSVGDFPHGPWYYYTLIIGETFFRSIYAPWITIIFVSLGSIVLFYCIGKSFGSRFFGAVLSLLVALSASQITLATGLTNTNTIFLCTTAVLFISLVLIRKGYSSILIFLLGLILSIGFFSHDEMASIFLLPPILLVGYHKRIIPSILWFLLGAAIPAVPLLTFDMHHGFLITQRVMFYILHGSTTPVYFPNSWKLYLLSFWPWFWKYTIGVTAGVGFFVAVIVLAVLTIDLIRHKLPKGVIFILIGFLANVLFYRYVTGGERVIYHTYFLQPFIFFLVGYALFRLYSIHWVFGYILTGALLCSMIPLSLKTLSVSPSHVAYEQFAQVLQKQLGGRSATMYYCTDSHKYQTYSVVFTLEERQLLGSDTKLGFASPQCQTKGRTITVQDIDGAHLQVINLTGTSDATLYRAGWVPVTPETIYNSIIHAYDPETKAYKELHIQ